MQEADPEGVVEGQLYGAGNGIHDGATIEELNAGCDLSSRIVTLSTTVTDYVGDPSDIYKYIRVANATTDRSVTLPPATGSGKQYIMTFVGAWGSVARCVIQVANASDTISGILLGKNTGGTNAVLVSFRSAADSDSIISDNDTTKAISQRNSFFRIVDIAPNKWVVQFTAYDHAGAAASPWAATV